MELLLTQPWKTEIGLAYFGTDHDMTALSNEIIAIHAMSHNDDDKPFEVTKDLCPLVIEFRDRYITPHVKHYIERAFNRKPNDIELKVDTFGKWFQQGQELGAHLHGGTAVTTVFYPADTQAKLMVFDPRFNASRGYPRDIRDNHFGEFIFHPKAGDLIIMPSYLMHSVTTVQEEARLSLVNDYSFV